MSTGRWMNFTAFDYLAPHLDESMSIFEFNSLTEQLSKLDERQETAMKDFYRCR